ncbi:sugar transport protein [Penicillium lagena]|uniref:sugar transport protein n=1 Tax=Penicillium lagena TaxID=94218 RepID=UPI00253F9CB7|nr:sugar transport protein [Penicillium lagena]KAJ5604620.1 sugar transport protein [Penicillium lagena]
MLILSTALLVISAFNYGFSDQAFASCQAIEAFIRQFGRYDKVLEAYEAPPLFTALYNSLKAGTQIIGVFVGSWISDRWGRRMCVFVMSVYALGSASVVISAQNDGQILAGRALHYVYLGMQLAVIPTTLAEIAPAKIRGAVGVLYWLNVKVGGFVVTAITRGTSTIPNNASWRIPFGLILIIPAIVISLIWFTPESPRWLLLRDRQEDALKSLTRLKHKNTSLENIQVEFDELSRRVSAQLQRRRFRDLFVAQNRQRTFVVIIMNFFQQASGQAFASQYGTLFVKALKTVNPFSVTLGTNATDIGALVISLLTIDILGRRTLMIVSSTLQSIALMAMGILGSVHDDNGVKEGIISMLLIFSFAWSLGWGPLTYVIGAEIPSAPLREATLQMAYTLKLVTEFAVTFSYPYLETPDDLGHVDLGGRLGFVYGSLAILSLLFSYFFIPETQGIELEDIDVKYGVQNDSNNSNKDMEALESIPVSNSAATEASYQESVLLGSN